GTVSFNPFFENDRAALLLVNNIVYLSFASLNDTTPYHGWILGYNADNLNLQHTFNDTPNGDKGAYWANSGPAADAAGNVFAIAGNGTPDPANGNYGQGFVKLQPEGSHMSVEDFFIMFNAAQLNLNDVDVGSGGPLLLPDQPGPHAHLLIG